MKNPRKPQSRRLPPTSQSGVWQLQEAKARFSEVVRDAKAKGPQRVTLHGRDAVVVIDAAEFERLQPAASRPTLHQLLSNSPLGDLDFDREGIRSPVRDVEL